MSMGLKTLGDTVITAAAEYDGTWVTGLGGVQAFTVQFRFAYGAGGTDARLYLQTSLDAGTTAVDLACVLFTTVSDTVILNFSGFTPLMFSGSPPASFLPTDGQLADNTSIDGVLGDRMRIKIISTGTYTTQTLLSSRITVR